MCVCLTVGSYNFLFARDLGGVAQGVDIFAHLSGVNNKGHTGHTSDKFLSRRF